VGNAGVKQKLILLLGYFFCFCFCFYCWRKGYAGHGNTLPLPHSMWQRHTHTYTNRKLSQVKTHTRKVDKAVHLELW